MKLEGGLTRFCKGKMDSGGLNLPGIDKLPEPLSVSSDRARVRIDLREMTDGPASSSVVAEADRRPSPLCIQISGA